MKRHQVVRILAVAMATLMAVGVPAVAAASDGGYSSEQDRLKVEASEYCLDAEEQTAGSNGTKVHLWPCEYGYNPNHEWYWDSGRIRNVRNHRCLDADLGTIDSNGTLVQLWDCVDHALNQQWYKEGSFIRNRRSHRVLDADYWTLHRGGTKVQLWDPVEGATNQAWHENHYCDGFFALTCWPYT